MSINIRKISLHVAIFALVFLPLLFMPLLASAQFGGNDKIGELFGDIRNFINNVLIPLVFAVALLIFIWGMFRFFIYGGHEDEEREKGKSLMIWSIVAFVLMVSIFGIVNLIAGGLGWSGKDLQGVPDVPTKSNNNSGSRSLQLDA